jgi:hypothetical protein
MKKITLISGSKLRSLRLMMVFFLCFSLVIPGFTLAQTNDEPLNDYEDLRNAGETISDQRKVIKDETVDLLIGKTVKSAKAFSEISIAQPVDVNLTPGQNVSNAVTESLNPGPLGSSITGSLESTTHPLAIASRFVAPIAIEGIRQAREGEKLDVGKLKDSVEPAKIAGATAGVIVADVVGVAVQSGLGAAFGGAGQVAGAIIHPLITWSGYYLGNNFGASVQDGKPSAKKALADTLREINPVKFACTVAGATAGGIIGQALIPIPVVGYIIGSVVGQLVGSALGNVIGKHGAIGRVNKSIIEAQYKKADELEGKTSGERLTVVGVSTDGTIVTSSTDIDNGETATDIDHTDDPTYIYDGEE